MNFLCRRAANGAPSAIFFRNRTGCGCDLIVGQALVDQPHTERIGDRKDIANQQNLKRNVGTELLDQRAHLFMRFDQPNFLDGHAKFAVLPTHPIIAAGRCCQATAHTQPVNLRNNGMTAFHERVETACRPRDIAHGRRFILPRGREFLDIGTCAERLAASPPDDDAT